MTMQPVVATVVLKIGSTGLHCDGCMNRIRSKLFKIKGNAHLHLCWTSTDGIWLRSLCIMHDLPNHGGGDTILY